MWRWREEQYGGAIHFRVYKFAPHGGKPHGLARIRHYSASNAAATLPGFVLSWTKPLLNRMDRFAYFKVPEMMDNHPNELYDSVQLHLSATTAKTANRASLVRSKGQAKTTYVVNSATGWILEVFEREQVWWKSSVHYPRPSEGARSEMAEPLRSLQLKIHKRNKGKILNR